MKTQVTIKTWTKSEMIDRVFEKVHWTPSAKERNKKRAMLKPYDRIWDVFTHYQNDQNQYLFYANLLTI